MLVQLDERNDPLPANRLEAFSSGEAIGGGAAAPRMDRSLFIQTSGSTALLSS
jgi:hypothetical protein